MQHHELTASPPPNVNPRDMPPRRLPESVIVCLFALRLAKELIEGLEYYPGRDADVLWIEGFLAPYHKDYALANISGRRRYDYLAMYPGIVARMRKQPRYPVRFMQLNPDRVAPQDNGVPGRATIREMTDEHRLAIIDFCDAANEWGSVVPIPAREAERMTELADQRRIADIDARPSVQGNVPAQTESSVPIQDDGYFQEERRR